MPLNSASSGMYHLKPGWEWSLHKDDSQHCPWLSSSQHGQPTEALGPLLEMLSTQGDVPFKCLGSTFQPHYKGHELPPIARHVGFFKDLFHLGRGRGEHVKRQLGASPELLALFAQGHTVGSRLKLTTRRHGKK